jgi:addiction module HigA family antidote
MTSKAIHPGEHLAEELDALDMSAAELARQLKVPTNRVTAILNGQRAISGDTALRLAHFFRNDPTVLAESSEPLRNSVGRKKGRKGHQKNCHR